MGTREKTEKQPKHRSRVGVAVLVILILLLATAGYVFYSVTKAPIALDDPRKMAESAPMSPQERFSVSAADRTVQVKVEAADIWNFVLTHAGDDFLELVNRELSAYSVSVSGCGIQIDENGLQLNLELFYENIRVAARIPCTLEASGQHFSLKPSGVKVGVIPLPIQKLLSSVKLEYDFQLPIVSDVTEVSYDQDVILITGSMEADIRALHPTDGTVYRVAVFSEERQKDVDAFLTEAGYAALFSHLEQKPEDIEAFYSTMFTYAGPELTQEYLDNHMGLMERILPGIDYSAMEAERMKAKEEVAPLVAILERFFTSVVSDYNGKVFRLSDGEFLKKLKPFHPNNYGSGLYQDVYDVLDTDAFFLVLVDVDNGYIRKTPVFSKLADENQQFTQPVDFEKTYILGFVFRSIDGDPFLMYEAECGTGDSAYRDIVLRPLTEENVSALQIPGKFGVWTD